jgi:hypothetical protein
MRSLSQIRLSEAERAFAASNTPSFLTRKLRADAAVKDLQRTYGNSALLRSLKRALKKKPKSLADAVRPYAYLVALSFDVSTSSLAEAAGLSAPHAQWYQAVAGNLMTNRTPVKFDTIKVPARRKEKSYDEAVNSTFLSISTWGE